MRENNQMIENRLKRAVENSVPDVLANVLEQIEEKQAEVSPGIAEVNSEASEQKVDEQGKIKAFPTWKRWPKALASVAAALVIVFGLWLNLTYSTETMVAFDVNPSIELSVNRGERIIKINPRNGEAWEVIGDMDLKGIDLEVGVNALIGSMVQKGYISELNNSILITVDSKDDGKGEELQHRLSSEVGSLLRSFSVDGSVLSQTSSRDRHFEELAEKYGISPSKAALIEQLVEADPTIRYEDVANLSINDLNLLIEARQPDLVKVDISGHASRKAYIGIDEAKRIAFEHAGVSESSVRELDIDYDYYGGRLIYEIEFEAGGNEYEFDIDARSGTILKYETDFDDDVTRPSSNTNGSNSGSTKPSTKPTTTASSLIGKARTENIAFQHAGVSRNQVRDLETELDDDDGRRYYEVEFEVGDTEYEYDIEAYTGKILDYEIDYDD